jgi:hypothetical protein
MLSILSEFELNVVTLCNAARKLVELSALTTIYRLCPAFAEEPACVNTLTKILPYEVSGNSKLKLAYTINGCTLCSNRNCYLFSCTTKDAKWNANSLLALASSETN